MTDLIPSRAGSVTPSWVPLIFVGLWTWAIWSCAEHWRGNPNYSYGWVVPILALGFGLRRWIILQARDASRSQDAVALSWPSAIIVALLAAAGVSALEFGRQEMWHPQIVLMSICFLAIAFSLVLFHWRGGSDLLGAEIFPVLFFLTAVPWPARLEQPITGALMRWVAAVTAECLHWMGVEAQTSGGAIALRSGLVGITEACSGIRSLQAGIMFGLALGEWFLLRRGRRLWLLAIAIVAAVLTNLGRTLALSLQAERHGVASVERVHDLIGNLTISALIAGIWIAGKLLASRPNDSNAISWETLTQRIRELGQKLLAPGCPQTALIAIVCLVGFVSARCLYATKQSREQTQLVAFFTARGEAVTGDQFVPVPKEIWNELHPTSGEYIRRQDAELPRGLADFYHFFWKPSPWNRFVLVHRPDICMPGVGWESEGKPEAVEVDFSGRGVRFYAFRFRRGEYHALQMWGVWRNGESVPLEYDAAQVLGTAPAPPSLSLEGKSRSATEIVACSLFSEQSAPPAELAVSLLRSAFEYKPQ